MDTIISLITAAVLACIGFFAGRMADRRHLASLREREAASAAMLVTDLKPVRAQMLAGSAAMVSGEAVISSDYYKTMIAGLKKIVGGELRSLESLMERARREAVLRMLEQARAIGCDAVCNVRIEGFDIAGAAQRKTGLTLVAVLAVGTAYKRRSS